MRLPNTCYTLNTIVIINFYNRMFNILLHYFKKTFKKTVLTKIKLFLIATF